MKKRFLLLIILFSACMLPGCSGKHEYLPDPPAWITQRKDDPRRMGAFLTSGIYQMDTRQSVVHWVGKKKWPYTEYKGTLNLAKGSLTVASGKITGGDFTIDMNTMDIVSLKNSPNDYKKMMDRLRNYFFYVQEYPVIFFQVVSISEANKSANPQATHLLTGKLTIKNKTNGITIPATVVFQGNELKAYSRFSINRNDYNIIYNENSFFGGLGNAAIKDSIDMALELIGTLDAAVKPNI